MYRGGLTRIKIAELVGVTAPAVGYHLRLACAADPSLRRAHGGGRPAPSQPASPRRAWRDQ